MTKIQQLSDQAYETILSKFPHYKTCFRISEKQYFERMYSACSDTLFYRLFFNTKKKITPYSNIFEVCFYF